MNQLDLFSDPKVLDEIEAHRKGWLGFWEWAGPTVGHVVEVGRPAVRRKIPLVTEESGETRTEELIYAYMMEARVLSISNDGKSIEAVLEGNRFGRAPHPEDGTIVVLEILEIDPPRRLINAQRREKLIAARDPSIVISLKA